MQTSIFDLMYDKFHLADKMIYLIEAFGGIGSQHKALSNLQEQGLLPNGFKAHKLIEFDEKCVQTYNAIHNTNFKPMDITKVHAEDLEIRERERVTYLMTYSFPCQDLSLCGKLSGMSKDSGTRSSLLWEVERLLNECGENLPQVLLMENVPMVISSKFIEDFRRWESFLASKGYSNYVKILNAKDYGIPQNRKRCFMVSILGEYSYEFPPEQELKLKLSDLLEDEVDEKYFLTPQLLKCFLGVGKDTKGFNREERFCQSLEVTNKQEVASTITTKAGSRPTDNYIIVKEATKKGYAEAHIGDGVDVSTRIETHRGVVQKGISQTIKTQIDVGVVVPKPQDAKVIGGIGNKCNKDKQYHMQNRVYEGDVANTIATCCNPFYAFENLATPPSGRNLR